MTGGLIDILGKSPANILTAAQLSAFEMGSVPAAVAATINPNAVADPLAGTPTGGNTTLNTGITHFCTPGAVKKTLLQLKALPFTLADATAYTGLEIFDFPTGRVLILGCVASLAITTTSVLASTLNASSTGQVGLGTATASATTLATTMQDLIPVTAFTSSATINVPSATVTAALAAAAAFDGTGTAKKAYLNIALATGTDIDADATLAIDGSIEITWIHLGRARLVNGA